MSKSVDRLGCLIFTLCIFFCDSVSHVVGDEIKTKMQINLFETLSQQLARIGNSQNRATLATYIYKVLRRRKTLLDRKDRVARVLL